MKRNMGVVDRLLRLIVAVILGALYYTGIITGTVGIILLIVAGIFIATSLFGVCPLYAIFGWTTRSAS